MGKYKEDTWSRIFERKQDVEFLLKKGGEETGEDLKALQVRVKDENAAQKKGISVHPDLSITAEFPEKGTKGWILARKPEETKQQFGDALEFFGNSITS